MKRVWSPWGREKTSILYSFAQPGEEKLQGDMIAAFQYLTRPKEKMGRDSL